MNNSKSNGFDIPYKVIPPLTKHPKSTKHHTFVTDIRQVYNYDSSAPVRASSKDKIKKSFKSKKYLKKISPQKHLEPHGETENTVDFSGLLSGPIPTILDTAEIEASQDLLDQVRQNRMQKKRMKRQKLRKNYISKDNDVKLPDINSSLAISYNLYKS